MTDFKVPSGIAAAGVYSVTMPEDEWLVLSPEAQQYIFNALTNAARENCVRFAVLRLVPDPLLPVHGKDAPYIQWQIDLNQEPAPPFKTAIRATYTLDEYTTRRAPPEFIMAVMKEVRRLPHGSEWQICNAGGNIIQSGIA